MSSRNNKKTELENTITSQPFLLLSYSSVISSAWMALIKLMALWQNYAILDAILYVMLFNVKLEFLENQQNLSIY